MTTTVEMLRCIERELKMRRSVYPRWIAKGRMSVSHADYEIRTMEAIEEHFLMVVRLERPEGSAPAALPGQQDLFSGEKVP
jgi:hypothetical protein